MSEEPLKCSYIGCKATKDVRIVPVRLSSLCTIGVPSCKKHEPEVHEWLP